jgi:hypothetical protein
VAVLTTGYGTGLTNKQKLSRAWVLKPTVYSTETVAVQLLFDGANWQVVGGEISDEAEMVIG